MHKNVVYSFKFALCSCCLRLLKLTYTTWFRTQVKTLSPSRECRKSDILDKHWFCNVFKNPHNVTKSIEVYSVEVLSVASNLKRWHLFLYVAYRGCSNSTTNLKEKTRSLQTDYTLLTKSPETVWKNLIQPEIEERWKLLVNGLFNTDQANYILYLYPLLLIWNESEKEKKKNQNNKTQSSLWSRSCQSCWVSSLVSMWSSLQQNSLSRYHGIFLSGSLVKYNRTGGRII